MTLDPHDPIPRRYVRDARPGEVYQPKFDGQPPFPGDPDHPSRQLYPGAPEALGMAARALARLAWTWLRTKLRRRPDPATLHQPWCPALHDDTPQAADCECWRFLLEADPTAETLIDPHDHWRTDG